MSPAANASDADLIALLRQGTIEENTALNAIYKAHYATVAGFVLRNSGDRESARDVFQDGMIVLYRNIKEAKFNGESAIGTYLFAICRFLWLKALKKRGRAPVEAIDPEAIFETPLINMLDEERRSVVLALFDKLGDTCKQILLLSFYDDLDMREIAARTGFKDEQNARNKKYKCLKTLKDLTEREGAFARSLHEIR
jgi:RNA polymerase sigma factor (sigma-70 family)